MVDGMPPVELQLKAVCRKPRGGLAAGNSSADWSAPFTEQGVSGNCLPTHAEAWVNGDIKIQSDLMT